MKLTFILLFILLSCSQLPSRRSDRYSIIQGITNSKEVEFSIVARENSNLRFELRSLEGEVVVPDETKKVERDSSDYVVYKIVFTRDQAKDYNLYVYENEKIVDQRLIGKGQRAENHLKLAVVSCTNDFYSEHFKIWNVLAAKNPEYLLMIGDNVYADAVSKKNVQVVDPDTLWKRYIETRLSLPIFFEQKLIPVHALWDDHDFGVNDGGAEYRYKNESKEIFETFYAQSLSDDDWSKGYGVGGLLSLGDFNLYFLDARMFRTSNSHLGLDQTAWFYSKIREEDTPSLIIKGDQFFGGYHTYQSFEGNNPDQFQQFVSELRQVNTPFIFVSGDRHMSEIMQFPRSLFGKPSFEITSSPMHGRVGDLVSRNPWRVVEKTGKVNFTIIDNLAKENHWFMDVESIGEDGEVYYKRELAVYIKDLQNNLNEARKRRIGKRRHRRSRRR